MTNYILPCLILHFNIFKKCITCNVSSLTLAHSQAGRRADDKAEEAGVLVLFFHLFFIFLMLDFVSLYLSARSMHCHFEHELQLIYLLIIHTVASALYNDTTFNLIFSLCTKHNHVTAPKWFHVHL